MNIGRLTLLRSRAAPPSGDAATGGQSARSPGTSAATPAPRVNGRTAIESLAGTESPAASRADGTATDRELLRRFLSTQDAVAFRQLVERHGGLVLGVASRVLRDRHLAEDAFQATFLVLARKAATIRRRTSLAAWLHGVARRIALRTLRQRYRRGEQPLNCEPPMDASPLALVGSQWEQQILDEELQQLPEAWRDPLLLHELEGLSCQATADRLGLTLTALEGRLKRGRKELKHRLLRRGLGMGAVLTAMQTAQATAGLQPATDLILAAVEASLGTTPSVAASEAAADVLNTPHHLATQELIAMSTVKTSTLVAVAATCCAAVGVIGGGWELMRPVQAAGSVSAYSVSLIAADGAPAEGPEAAASVTPTTTHRRVSESENKIITSLKELVELEFVDTELTQVIQYLTERYQIPIIPDTARLTEFGVSMDQPVSLVLSGVSLESALNLILEQHDLDYIVSNEVMRLTTREFAEQDMETRVYELRRLPASFKPEDVARVIVRTVRPDSWGDTPWVYIVPTPTEAATGMSGGIPGAGSDYPGGGRLGTAAARRRNRCRRGRSSGPSKPSPAVWSSPIASGRIARSPNCSTSSTACRRHRRRRLVPRR